MRKNIICACWPNCRCVDCLRINQSMKRQFSEIDNVLTQDYHPNRFTSIGCSRYSGDSVCDPSESSLGGDDLCLESFDGLLTQLAREAGGSVDMGGRSLEECPPFGRVEGDVRGDSGQPQLRSGVVVRDPVFSGEMGQSMPPPSGTSRRNSSSRARGWVFTAHLAVQVGNPVVGDVYLARWGSQVWKDLVSSSGIVFLCFQLEKAPDTGREHFQGFAYFRHPVPFDTALVRVREVMARDDGYEICHPYVAAAKGTPEQCQAYCSKSESAVEGSYVEFGKCPKQGTRSDINQVKDDLQSGMSLKDCFLTHPEVCVKYSRGIQLLCDYVQSVPRDPSTPSIVEWWFGPTGTGKSRRAFQLYPQAYVKMSLNRWWDGYAGEKITIIDDYRPDFSKFSEFLRYLDRYPMRVECKGSSMHLQVTHWVITTCSRPEELWKGRTNEQLGQLLRRITSIVEFYNDGDMHVWKDENTVYQPLVFENNNP